MGGRTIVKETTGRLEIEVADKSTIVVKTQDLGKLTEGNWLVHPDGTRELIDFYTATYRADFPAIATLKRISNSQPPQIKSTFYQMDSREPWIVFVEDYSSMHTEGVSESYDMFNKVLSEAGE